MNRRLAFLLILMIIGLRIIAGQPSGAQIEFNETETKGPQVAEYLNTSGGTFTTVILSSESQNLKWKAYAGNVTGVLTLDDSGDYSIFQWELTDYTGQVYASRDDNVTWSSIACASTPQIESEDTAMNHTSSSDDSINSTFNLNIHKEFYVGTQKINQSTCFSQFTWVNDTAQVPAIDAPFQEVLLHDGANMVYTTFIDDNVQGFNYKNYDFQMIVAERGIGGYENTPYYFYLELQ